MGLRMKNFNTMGVHCKTQFLGEGRLQKNQYIEGNCLKRGAWTVCRFKEGLAKKRGVGFFRGGGGWYPNAHYGFQKILKNPQITPDIVFFILYGPECCTQMIHTPRDSLQHSVDFQLFRQKILIYIQNIIGIE